MPFDVPADATVFDALLTALEDAANFNSQVERAPLAVLWPDEKREWLAALPRVRARRTVLTLGEYDTAALTGPAFWIRAVLARALPEVALKGDIPIVYLPGVARASLKATDETPGELSQLVYLQFRGATFGQANGKDMTLSAFVQNKDAGLGVALVGAVNEALLQTLPKLLDQRVEKLRAIPGGLRADWLYALDNPDLPRRLLEWIDDPDAVKTGTGWPAFCAQAKSAYNLDPASETPLEAARLLGEQLSEPWRQVWERYRFAPRRFPLLPDRLHAAKPPTTLPMFSPAEVTWPQVNEAAETELRAALTALTGARDVDARDAIETLEATHGARRGSVWADLERTPLANALAHLAVLARESVKPVAGGSFEQLVADYRDRGWLVDAAMIDALAAVSHQADRAAVNAAIHALYYGWLKTSAVNFQTLLPPQAPGAAADDEPGTCLVFADGLRYDLGKRLESRLANQAVVTLDAGICALPSVTPTAKPAVSPIADLLTGGEKFSPRIIETGSTLTPANFNVLLGKAGWTVLGREERAAPGPDARGWTEFGEFDKLGHNHPEGLPAAIGRQIEDLAARVEALLESGWARVVVVTDHGWLLMPGGLPKSLLAEHLTEERKGRCARLKPSSITSMQKVPWRWDPAVQMAMAPNITCFEEGKTYEHGGLSPQECIVPRLTVTKGTATAPVVIESVRWRGLRCDVALGGAGIGFTVDLRTKPAVTDSSIVASAKQTDASGGAKLVVDDDEHLGAAATVVVLNRQGRIVTQHHTTVGEET